MSTKRHSSSGYQSAPVFVMVVLLLCSGAPAWAGQFVETLAGNVSPTPVFMAGPGSDEGKWLVPDATFSEGTANQQGGGLTWYIAPTTPYATFNWWGSLLEDDLSNTPPDYVGMAAGKFFGGGTITLDGELWDLGAGGVVGGGDDVLIYDGMLLEGEVSPFTAREFFPMTSILIFKGGAKLHPTGGYLMTSTPMRLANADYDLSILISVAQQNGSGVQDFQKDIISVSSLQFAIVIPEPATAGLLAAGLGVFVLRRRKGA